MSDRMKSFFESPHATNMLQYSFLSFIYNIYIFGNCEDYIKIADNAELRVVNRIHAKNPVSYIFLDLARIERTEGGVRSAKVLFVSSDPSTRVRPFWLRTSKFPVAKRMTLFEQAFRFFEFSFQIQTLHSRHMTILTIYTSKSYFSEHEVELLLPYKLCSVQSKRCVNVWIEHKFVHNLLKRLFNQHILSIRRHKNQ